jgi:ribulose-phosphate 3-epimerase
VVAAIRPHTALPFDVHLMIESPENYLKQFAQAGANIITVHAEACGDIEHIVEEIKRLGVKAGVSLKPDTPVDTIDAVLPELDLVLVMTVNPGFGGQSFIESTVDKIAAMRRKLDERGLKAELEVDGGVNVSNAARVVRAGARVLVAGSAVFNHNFAVVENIRKLRESINLT